MEPVNLKKLNVARRERIAAVLVTDFSEARDRVVREGDLLAGELGEAIERAFRSGKSGLASVDAKEFFLNVHLPPPRIVVIGAVHISQALAPIAKISGYDLEIIDPRTAFATPERFAGVELSAKWPQEVLKDKPLDAYTALVAVTHDPKIDDFPIIAALKAKCFYVGALGSRKTHAKRVDRLKEARIEDAEIARIHAPIGLDIGASSPAEIAVATMAQIISAFRKRELSN
jgi:xanthine dehydrogenase accessory factor